MTLAHEYLATSTRLQKMFCKIFTAAKTFTDSVVESYSINSFKNNLDKFWQNEDVKFNWKANLTGAGSRSLSLT